MSDTKNMSWLNKDFVLSFVKTINEVGFVSNEHIFTPYRETMYFNLDNIVLYLKNTGITGIYLDKKIVDSEYGLIYCIYDKNKIVKDVENTVIKWLDEQYSEEF